MAISRSKLKSKAKQDAFDFAKVPFVPALDLLEKKRRELTPEEVAAVALTLFLTTQNEQQNTNLWNSVAKLESISQRL